MNIFVSTPRRIAIILLLLIASRQCLTERNLLLFWIASSDGGGSTRMSGFLLSLVSPVLHKMVCGAFKESASRRLTLGEMEERAFVRVVGLACGVASMEGGHVMEVVKLAKVADRLQMSEVVAELSGTICRELSVEVCAEVLGASGAWGLGEVEGRCRRMAQSRADRTSDSQR